MSLVASLPFQSKRSSSSSSGGGSGGTPKSYVYIILAFLLLTVVSLVGNRVKASLEVANNDQEMIDRYLLKKTFSSTALAVSKPKLWIHTKYEKNARKWDSFHARTNKNVNQPYLNLTVETIVNHCSEDFDICLIDDESFSFLLPDWKLSGTTTTTQRLQYIPDPMKSQLRKEGMLQLLFKYGGLIVPNSFIAFQNLIHLYDNVHTNGGKPFMVELPSSFHSSSSSSSASIPIDLPFVPSLAFIGAKREDPVVAEMIQVMELVHSRQENRSVDLLGTDPWIEWCIFQIQAEKSIQLIGGEEVGTKTRKGVPVTIESLFQEDSLDLMNTPTSTTTVLHGIYLPADELLARTKYQWFCVLPKEDIYRSNAIVAKYILASLLEFNDEHLALARKREPFGGSVHAQTI